MLDGLLGRGFAFKCKSLIKLTKARIDVIRRKRNATQKFLKKDIADLLVNGLDINAFGRAEGLLVELIYSSCYDFVERCCDLVVKHLSIMQKLRECPEECRAAVSSLMFAAARFSDLPELRDLRETFYERYGNSLELFVNQEFVENLASKPCILENKVKLMKDIATEFSIKWDSKAFEQKMNKPSTLAQHQPKAYGSFHVNDDKSNLPTVKDMIVKEDRHGISENGYKSFNGKERTTPRKDGHDIMFQGTQECVPDKQQAFNPKGNAPSKAVRLGSSSQGKRLDYIDTGAKLDHGGENNISVRDAQDTLYSAEPRIADPLVKRNGKGKFAGDNNGGQHVIASPQNKDGLTPKLRPYYNNALPPPYVKSNGKAKDRKNDASLGSLYAGFDGNVVLKNSSTNNTLERIQLGHDPDHERYLAGTARIDSHDHEKDHINQDEVTSNPIPKPRSARRKHSKSRSHLTDTGNSEDAVVVTRRSRSSRRRDDSKRGLQTLLNEEHYHDDEEERIIDRLLIHYSKKPSAYEPGKLRRKSKSRHGSHGASDVGESPQDGNTVGPDEVPEMVKRSVSLPHENAGPSQPTKVFTRAASFQPERSNAARHVHPKLPDYDDLAARFAALKGR
ncbi:uncharacterized protein LOC107431867 isoform X2 [Ziziphus jujuba]|uniref:Uncharacterized protein LOC107431867 isoform X2 n=1 Tax=Ziziphus jujuba TaxID=326968 RepID=A0ABM3ZW28_ZIZJJ|nr:uncharacterized protein LOC107431867 isoform X2 [Ziziphus jujuba var. spinosa]XP_060668684.1 uncharacterized protein LOC107431867 isoform X2 [Ziziphus jujuba]